MKLISALLGLSALVSSTLAAEKKYFLLTTKVQPGQADVDHLNNLVATETLTGNKMGYLLLLPHDYEGPQFYYLEKNNETSTATRDYYNVVFDGESDGEAYYVDLQKGLIDFAIWNAAGVTLAPVGSSIADNAFFINSTGLQWTSNTSKPDGETFRGWLACTQWWFGYPQLFYYGADAVFIEQLPVPPGCAIVDLKPVYLSND